MKTIRLLLVSLILVLLFQNCSEVHFLSLHGHTGKPTTQELSSGNGEPYDGKLALRYNRRVPNFQCEGVSSNASVIEISEVQTLLWENEPNQCASSSQTIATESLVHSPHNPYVISHQNLLFTRDSNDSRFSGRNYAETWCHSSKGGSQNVDIIITQDQVALNHEAHIVLAKPDANGTLLKYEVQPLSVSRKKSQTNLSYSSPLNSSFLLNLNLTELLVNGAASHSGVFKAKIDGDSYDIPVTCYLGGELDPLAQEPQPLIKSGFMNVASFSSTLTYTPSGKMIYASPWDENLSIRTLVAINLETSMTRNLSDPFAGKNILDYLTASESTLIVQAAPPSHWTFTDPPYHLYLLNSNTLETQRLTRPTGASARITYSKHPHQPLLAYWHDNILSLINWETEVITTHEISSTNDPHMEWTPDGKRLVLTLSRSAIATYELADQQLKTHIDYSSDTTRRIEVTSDSRGLVWADNNGIWWLEFATGRSEKLSPDNLSAFIRYNSIPKASPNGRYAVISLEGERPESPRLLVFDLYSKKIIFDQSLLDLDSNSSWGFSPDSESLLFNLRQKEEKSTVLVRYHIATGKSEHIEVMRLNGDHQRAFFSSFSTHSHDGKTLYFLFGDSQTETTLLMALDFNNPENTVRQISASDHKVFGIYPSPSGQLLFSNLQPDSEVLLFRAND